MASPPKMTISCVIMYIPIAVQTKATVPVANDVFARGQSRAKLRVIYFLTVFVVTGFFSEFIFSRGFVPILLVRGLELAECC